MSVNPFDNYADAPSHDGGLSPVQSDDSGATFNWTHEAGESVRHADDAPFDAIGSSWVKLDITEPTFITVSVQPGERFSGPPGHAGSVGVAAYVGGTDAASPGTKVASAFLDKASTDAATETQGFFVDTAGSVYFAIEVYADYEYLTSADGDLYNPVIDYNAVVGPFEIDASLATVTDEYATGSVIDRITHVTISPFNTWDWTGDDAFELVSIDWGDGNTDTSGFPSYVGAAWVIAHQYAAPGLYTVTVTITDPTGHAVDAASTKKASVPDVDLTITPGKDSTGRFIEVTGEITFAVPSSRPTLPLEIFLATTDTGELVLLGGLANVGGTSDTTTETWYFDTQPDTNGTVHVRPDAIDGDGNLLPQRVFDFVIASLIAPPQRQYPRDDGLGISTRRSWPPPTTKQFGLRKGPVGTVL